MKKTCVFAAMLVTSFALPCCAFGAPTASVLPSAAYVYASLGGYPAATSNFNCFGDKPCSELLGDGAREYFDYAYGVHNPYGELATTLLIEPNDTIAARLSTRYRLDGRVSGESTVAADGTDRETTDRYDALGRLIGRDRTDAGNRREDERFAYDANGNMVLRGSAHSAYDGLDRRGTDADGIFVSAPYDARGSLLDEGDGLHYVYDDEAQMIGATNASGQDIYRRWIYRYWPGGLRASKAAASGEALDYYYAGEQLADTENTATQRLSHYLLANGREWRGVVDAHGQLAQTRYAIADYLGSVAAETDGQGALLQTRAYSAYGRPLSHGQNQTVNPLDLNRNPFGFDGEYQDPEIDGLYLRAREYDTQGSFTTQDSLQNLNRYAAFDEEPQDNIDPDGHQAISAWSAWTFTSGFKYVGLLKFASMFWNADAMSQDDLLGALGTSFFGTIPLIGAGLADAIQQTVVEGKEALDWGRLLAVGGTGLAFDLATWGIRRHHNAKAAMPHTDNHANMSYADNFLAHLEKLNNSGIYPKIIAIDGRYYKDGPNLAQINDFQKKYIAKLYRAKLSPSTRTPLIDKEEIAKEAENFLKKVPKIFYFSTSGTSGKEKGAIIGVQIDNYTNMHVKLNQIMGQISDSSTVKDGSLLSFGSNEQYDTQVLFGERNVTVISSNLQILEPK